MKFLIADEYVVLQTSEETEAFAFRRIYTLFYKHFKRLKYLLFDEHVVLQTF